MKLVVKIGGHAAEDRALRRQLARQITQLCRSGHQVVVAHGGGRMLTQTLERLGIATKFHDGLRVTDAATRDVALMVLAGIVNKQWVAELEAQGQRALGICGGDAGLVVARKLTVGVNGGRKSLGFVGRPQRIDTRILHLAFQSDIVPVVASLGLTPGGEYLNVNADDLAAALATALRADRLLYVTESGGVWDAERRRLPMIKLNEIPSLIRRGIVRDGMIPKLRSCARTLRHNVGEIDLISATAREGLLRVVEDGALVGTRIVKGEKL
jgi:acetylglutamate kinase